MHIAQLMPLPLTVSCFRKIQIGFTFLVPAHPGSPGQRVVKRVCDKSVTRGHTDHFSTDNSLDKQQKYVTSSHVSVECATS